MFAHQIATRGARTRAKGPGGSSRGDGILCFPAAEPEEAAARAGSNGHLRKDGKHTQAFQRQAGETGARAASRKIEARLRKAAGTTVPGSAAARAAQVRDRQATASP